VDFGVFDKQFQVEVFNLVGDCLTFVLVFEMTLFEVNKNARRLDIFGNVDELFHAWHTLRENAIMRARQRARV